MKKPRHGRPPKSSSAPVQPRLQPNTLAIAIIGALLLCGVALRLKHLHDPIGRTPDEITYTRQGAFLALNGITATPELVRQYNSDPQQWWYPPPTRIGYLWLLSRAMHSVLREDEYVGAYLSRIFSCLSLFLLTVMGLRFFNPWVTALGLAFAIVYPVDLALAQRAWQDAMVGCVGFLLVYLACELALNPASKGWRIAFILTGSYMLLIKESGVVIYGLCGLWIILAAGVFRRQWKAVAEIVALAAAGAVVSAGVLLAATGGFEPLFSLLRHEGNATQTIPYARLYQSGPLYRFLIGLWLVSPLSMTLTVVAAIIACLQPKIRLPLTWLSLLTLTFVLITGLTPHVQNLRYLSPTYAPMALLSGFVLWFMLATVGSRFGPAVYGALVVVTILAVLLNGLRSYSTFERKFINGGLVDPSIRFILEKF